MKPFRWPKIRQDPVERVPALDLNVAEEELTGIVQGYPATDIEERMYIAFLHDGTDNEDIEYQPSYIAGRNMAGEIRPDFATYDSGLIRIWYADEEFFHKSAEQQAKDKTNDAILFQRMQGQIEFPYRVPGDDLDTQEDADLAIANPSKYQHG